VNNGCKEWIATDPAIIGLIPLETDGRVGKLGSTAQMAQELASRGINGNLGRAHAGAQAERRSPHLRKGEFVVTAYEEATGAPRGPIMPTKPSRKH
jgi:hypothetical protein